MTVILICIAVVGVLWIAAGYLALWAVLRDDPEIHAHKDARR